MNSKTPDMFAMVLEQMRQPLRPTERHVPEPQAGQVPLRIDACAVCRTDLHVIDGELSNPKLPLIHPKLPLIPGHEIAGTVQALGEGVVGLHMGQRVGVPWLGWTCGLCRYCQTGHENLCDQALFTGYNLDGGCAEYTVSHARFCFPIPDSYSAAQAAPLLCAGLIGYRSL